MSRGRPRKSDPDEVLEKALKLFWKNGFAATSMNDVSLATGMAKPGLYATFGNKEDLYEKALQSYFDQFTESFGAEFASSQNHLRDALGDLFESVIDRATGGSCTGCFLLNTVVETADNPSNINTFSRDLGKTRHRFLAQKFTEAKARHHLAPDADTEHLAQFVAGQMLAIAALASEGARREDLQAFAKTALRALPFVGLQIN